MTQHTAAHTAGGVEDAVSARLAAAALWALQGPGALDVRTGVVYAPGNPMLVTGTASTSPWTVTVNAGHVVGSKGSTNGPYYAANDGLYTLTMTVPPASNSRIDVVYAMQMDSAAILNADASTAAVIGVAPGSPAASPAVPAIPSGAVALAQVLIASTATAGTSGAGVTITDVRQFTATRGAPIPVRSQADRDALTATDGLAVLRLDLHLLERYNLTLAGWFSDRPYGYVTPTINALWNTDPLDGLRFYQDGYEVSLVGGVVNAATGSISTSEAPLGSIPAAYAPKTRKLFPATALSGTTWIAANVAVQTTGVLTFNLSAATPSMTAGTFILAVGNAAWRVDS